MSDIITDAAWLRNLQSQANYLRERADKKYKKWRELASSRVQQLQINMLLFKSIIKKTTNVSLGKDGSLHDLLLKLTVYLTDVHDKFLIYLNASRYRKFFFRDICNEKMPCTVRKLLQHKILGDKCDNTVFIYRICKKFVYQYVQDCQVSTGTFAHFFRKTQEQSCSELLLILAALEYSKFMLNRMYPLEIV